LMLLRLRASVLILTIASFALVDISPVHAQTATANSSLVIAALRVLESDYFKPVEAGTLLNAAIAALRKATNQGADALPDIPSGVQETQAVATFKKEFAQAEKGATVPETELAYTATREMLASLHDSHVFYMNPAEWKARQDIDSGKTKYGGIGTFIKRVQNDSGDNEFFVTDVFRGSPAASAGVQPFDRITAVNGTPIAPTATVNDVSAQIRGAQGSPVTLTIQRGAQGLTISINRAMVEMPAVEVREIEPRVAYVRLRAFSTSVGAELRRLLKPINSQGPIRSVVLDLRGNRGGWSVEAESVAGVFLPSGTMLAQMLERTGPKPQVAKGDCVLPKATVTILADEGSASASEVVAEGMRVAQRATLVGEKTAGALGLGHFKPLPAGAMEVTVSEVVGPHYEQIERVGIVPDNEVKLSVSDMENGVDSQLQAALKAIGGMLAAVWAAA
jgi:carboxyl-terminal processing protease